VSSPTELLLGPLDDSVKWSCLREVLFDKQTFVCFSIENLFDGGRIGWAEAGSFVFLFKKTKHKCVIQLELLLLDVTNVGPKAYRSSFNDD